MAYLITIETFDWRLSLPIPSMWDVKYGIGNIATKNVIFFMEPDPNVPILDHENIMCQGVVSADYPNVFVMSAADQTRLNMVKKTALGMTFFHHIAWQRLHKIKFPPTASTYRSSYAQAYRMWCEVNPREAWGLEQMPPGSTTRNEYVKQIIGLTRHTKSAQEISNDLWRYADQVERETHAP